jgi:hypothetical protein
MTETGDCVGVIPVSVNPDAVKRARNCASLRSMPSDTIVSMMSRRPDAGIALRTLPRIRTRHHLVAIEASVQALQLLEGSDGLALSSSWQFG